MRERDRERFLSALFAPADRRRQLFALYAFDLEIERVPDAVHEPMAGEIRFQWWREVLEGERKEEAAANPVAAALLDMIHESGADARILVGVIDARQFDLLGQPMQSQDALEQYLDSVSGSIIGVASKILDRDSGEIAAVRPAGRCAGIVRILRNLARDVAKGRLFLPLDILAANNVHTASVFAGEDSEGLRKTRDYLAVAAAQYFLETKQAAIPPRVLPAFLPLALASAYVARFRKAADPFRSQMELSALRSQFLLWRAARRGRI